MLNDDVIMSTLKIELQLYWWLSIWPTKIENVIIWRANHAMQCPHVSFLIHQIFNIVGSKIEIELICNVVNVIITIRWFRLRIKSLDQLIFIVKNWPNDTHVGCDGPLNLKLWLIFWKGILLWLKSTTNWSNNKIFFRIFKLSFHLISSSGFSFHPCVFFLLEFFDASILIMFFSWCVYNDWVENWTLVL
jgi:hypothetical protein